MSADSLIMLIILSEFAGIAIFVCVFRNQDQ
jgi:hypothetical protein